MPDNRPTLSERITRTIDAVVDAVAPNLALKRQTARQLRSLNEQRGRIVSRLMERHFDGADNDSRLRGDRWLASRLSIDSALDADLADLRENADELYRTFGYITGAIDHRTDNVIGTGLNPKAWIQPYRDLISAEQAKVWNEELNELYRRWAPHAGGRRRSFSRLQRLAHRTWRKGGDSFIVLSDVGRANSPIPLQLNVVGPKRVETPYDQAASPRIRLGVQKTEDGREIEGYWIRETDPHDTVDNTPKHRFYPADRVCHLLEELWPDQSRGLPWCFSIIPEAKDFLDYRETVIINAQIGACQTAFINTSNPELYGQNGLNSAGQVELEPGRFTVLGHGDTVTPFNPSQPQTTYGMFSEWSLLGMSAGINYPFGWMVKDRRRATFSAGRLEEIDGSVPLRSDFETVRNNFIAPVWERLVAEAVILGESTIPPDLFHAMPWLFTRFKLLAQGRPWIDPTKEVTAAILAKEHNLDTLEGIHSKLGKDTEEVLDTRAAERGMEYARDIVPPIYTGTVPKSGEDDQDGDEDDPDPVTDPADEEAFVR